LFSDERSSWKEQIICSRNISNNWLSFYLMCGLDFQIEHHLFPYVSRFRFWEMQKVVKEFCRENNIPYKQVNIFQSLKEMYFTLNEVRKYHEHD
jgi:fatty acid desaturase